MDNPGDGWTPAPAGGRRLSLFTLGDLNVGRYSQDRISSGRPSPNMLKASNLHRCCGFACSSIWQERYAMSRGDAQRSWSAVRLVAAIPHSMPHADKRLAVFRPVPRSASMAIEQTSTCRRDGRFGGTRCAHAVVGAWSVRTDCSLRR